MTDLDKEEKTIADYIGIIRRGLRFHGVRLYRNEASDALEKLTALTHPREASGAEDIAQLKRFKETLRDIYDYNMFQSSGSARETIEKIEAAMPEYFVDAETMEEHLAKQSPLKPAVDVEGLDDALQSYDGGMAFEALTPKQQASIFQAARLFAQGTVAAQTDGWDRTNGQRLDFIAKKGFNWRDYCIHVLQRGGDGDRGDFQSFIDALPEYQEFTAPSRSDGEV